MDKKQEEIKKVQRQMLLVQIIDAPGAILVGLALYAEFGSNGEPFIPILKNEIVVSSMFVIGMMIMLWGGFKIVTLAKKIRELQNEKNQ